MNTTEQDVARHYTVDSLEALIQSGLARLGEESGDEAIDRLAAVDEFHIGGREATKEVAGQLELRPGLSVLDVGCGIGGAARFLAARFGCRVSGVDLTPEYVAVGGSLNRRVGLAGQIDLQVASALSLPFDASRFDRATLLHVGMNIPDKKQLCAEAGRVLKPGGLFAVYDVMRTGEAAVAYPVPWAATETTSFLAPPDEYRRALEAAGFEVTSERNRRDFALAFFRMMQSRAAQGGPPPLGLHIMMGRDAATKVANMIANVERGAVAPVELIARRR